MNFTTSPSSTKNGKNPTEQSQSFLYQTIKHESATLLPNRNGKNFLEANVKIQPEQEEIQASIQLLKNKFPHLSIQKIVLLLYSNLTQNSEQIQENSNLQDNFIKTQLEREIYSNKLQQDSQNKHQFAESELEKRKIAQIFCNKGYGIHFIRQELQKGENTLIYCLQGRNKYKNVMGGVVTIGFRRLQELVQLQCKRQEMRSVLTQLLNCRLWMQSNHLQTFHDCIKEVFELDNIELILSKRLISLYEVIIKLVRGNNTKLPSQEIKIETLKEILQKKRKQKIIIWTAQLQKQICYLYLQLKKQGLVRNQLRKIHPELCEYLTVKEIKSQFYKLMRSAIKKIQTKTLTQKIQPLNINDEKIKMIIGSPDALTARINILKCYLSKNFQVEQMQNTIISINKFLNAKGITTCHKESNKVTSMRKYQVVQQTQMKFPILDSKQNQNYYKNWFQNNEEDSQHQSYQFQQNQQKQVTFEEISSIMNEMQAIDLEQAELIK